MFRDPALRDTLYSTINMIAYYIIVIYYVIMVTKKRNLLGGLTLGFSKHLADKSSGNFIIKILSNITLLTVLESVAFFYGQYDIAGRTNLIFSNWFGTGTNYFGLLTASPILSFILCVVLWVNPLKQMDIVASIFPLALAVTKFACFSAGCCHGAEWIYGTFNYLEGRPEVPVQLIEAFWGFLIFFILLKYKKKAKPGTLYPMYLILFSSTRFFSEFLRGEENVLGPLKTYHLLCLGGLVCGIVLYVIVIKFGDKITNLFENTTYFTKGKLHEKVVAKRDEIANTDFRIKLKKKAKEPVTK